VIFDRRAASLGEAARRDRAVASISFAALLAAGALLPPRRPLPFDLCALRRLIALPCLTCGLTRSVCLILQGHWADGVALHPAGPIAILLIGGAVLWLGAEAITGRRLGGRLPAVALRVLLGGGVVLSIAVWVGRLAMGGWPARLP